MEKKLKIVAIIQARFESKRFRGKVLKKINNKTLLEILLKRLTKSKLISKIVVATSTNKSDVQIIKEVKKLKFQYYKGSESDVLKRYFQASKKFNAEIIVRITSDCPLIDPEVVDNVISKFLNSNYDYISNINPPTFPDGMDVEVFPFKVLKQINSIAKKKSDREHVTSYIRNHKNFKKFNVKYFKDISKIRLCVDYQEDLTVIKKILKLLNNNIYSNLEKILIIINKNPKTLLPNKDFIRNDGEVMNEGQKTWVKAKKIIPGGTMLFSKNPDLYLPKFWPAYFSKTKGCSVWDLEQNKYIDFSYMGLGTNILGYSNKQVDYAVKETINNGNMSTLNCKEEVELAERLIDLHPWAEMARFARTGGEAAAVAVRLARASTARDKIAVCGYHGWHDWYLAANLNNKNNLNNHLMRNLNIKGVPQSLKNTCFSFEYNNFNEFNNIIRKNNIGAVIMEVSRFEKPKNNFLKKIKKICYEKNIVLIFDECTSGFRENFGGLHLKYNVNPDICLFGKALGNGYPINSIIGKKEIMKSLDSTFISSTFWTDRIGSVAALKTLEIMEKTKSWKIISNLGLKIRNQWSKIAKINGVDIKIKGLLPLPRFEFKKNHNYKKTYITQEFLKKNILANDSIYLSTSHDNKNILNKYYDLLNKYFKIIKKNEDVDSLNKLLDGPVSISGLRSKEND